MSSRSKVMCFIISNQDWTLDCLTPEPMLSSTPPCWLRLPWVTCFGGEDRHKHKIQCGSAIRKDEQRLWEQRGKELTLLWGAGRLRSRGDI